MDGLKFVKFDKGHLDEALKIYNYYILNSTATFSIEPLIESDMEKLVFSGLVRFPSFAIFEGDRMVGYSLLNRYKPREAYDKTAEVTVYLEPSAIGKGFGKKALEYLEVVARELEFRALLAVICAENIESIRVFSKLDYFECAHFRQVGEKFGRILDVIIYEKLL